jgi:hydroxymethylpyrimidine/phosphomethylpyrimidine kinase
MKTALTVAGFDPSGGAGIQADLKVFHSLGVYGISAVTSLTAQSTRGVASITSVDSQFVKKQLSVLLSDMRPGATKTGMLYSDTNLEVLVSVIKKYSLKNIIVDPVLVSSSGKNLARRNVPALMKKKLLPLCRVTTPNIYEASILTGHDIKNRADMEKAAALLRGCGVENIIITGGHLKRIAVDLLYDGDIHYLESRKVKGEYHGTGCVFSAIITALLAKGYNVLSAAKRSKALMDKAFRKSLQIGNGMKLLDI